MGEQGKLFNDDTPPVPPQKVVAAIEAYNALAPLAGWRTAAARTKSRYKAVMVALKEYGGLEEFRVALERAARSPFLTGKVLRPAKHQHWRPSLEFFCQPKSITNLLDGVYDDDGTKPETWRERQIREAAEAVEKAFKQ